MPSDAATTVAVVEAMPLVVNTWLYGASGPVSFVSRSWRTDSPSSSPVISSPL